MDGTVLMETQLPISKKSLTVNMWDSSVHKFGTAYLDVTKGYISC